MGRLTQQNIVNGHEFGYEKLEINFNYQLNIHPPKI